MQIAFIDVEVTPGCPKAGLHPWSLITVPLAPSPLPFTCSTPVPQGMTTLKTPHTTPLKAPAPRFTKCVCFSFCHPAGLTPLRGLRFLVKGPTSPPVPSPARFPSCRSCLLAPAFKLPNFCQHLQGRCESPPLCKQDMQINPSYASLQCIHQPESYFQVENDELAHLVVVVLFWG